MTKEFFHECNPPTGTAQQRKHIGGGKSYLPAPVKLAKAVWQTIMAKYAPETPLRGAITCEIGLTFPLDAKSRQNATECEFRPYLHKPDVDNIAKMILDAATAAGWWKDDAQVCKLTVSKMQGPITGISFSASAEVEK